MHKPRLKNILKNSPITLEVDGVVHKFRYLDLTTDLPSTSKTWYKALNLMKTPADFQNVPLLLEGCVRDRRRVPKELRNKIIRRAAMHDSLPVIIDCLLAVKRTGFKLNEAELINDLLTYAQLPAIKSGWSEKNTNAALRQVRLIVNLLEDEAHAPTAETKCHFPFYKDPQVLAARLHLAAAKAVHLQEGKDADGKVTEYAKELVALWPENAGLLDLQPEAAYRNPDQTQYLTEKNKFLWFASPVLSALNLATKVVAADNAALAQKLQQRAKLVGGELKLARDDESRKQGSRGDYLYDTLIGGIPAS